MRWSVPLWAMLASPGLHATRSSFIASLNCKSARQESFFMRIARRLLLPSLTSKLSWIPLYEQSRIHKCSIIYKRINGTLPVYLNDHIIINNNRHARNTRYANINIVCPKYRRETEGGRTFSVYAAKLWNSVQLDTRKADSLPCLRTTRLAEFKGSATIASL